MHRPTCAVAALRMDAQKSRRGMKRRPIVVSAVNQSTDTIVQRARRGSHVIGGREAYVF
jgi:hypothetical protein